MFHISSQVYTLGTVSSKDFWLLVCFDDLKAVIQLCIKLKESLGPFDFA